MYFLYWFLVAIPTMGVDYDYDFIKDPRVNSTDKSPTITKITQKTITIRKL